MAQWGLGGRPSRHDQEHGLILTSDIDGHLPDIDDRFRASAETERRLEVPLGYRVDTPSRF